MAVSANDFGLKSPIYKQDNTDVLVKTGIGRLRGILVTFAKVGPTLEIMDNTSNANPVLVREFVPTEATYYDFGDVAFGTGLYIVVGGLVAFTVFYF